MKTFRLVLGEIMVPNYLDKGSAFWFDGFNLQAWFETSKAVGLCLGCIKTSYMGFGFSNQLVKLLGCRGLWKKVLDLQGVRSRPQVSTIFAFRIWVRGFCLSGMLQGLTFMVEGLMFGNKHYNDFYSGEVCCAGFRI